MERFYYRTLDENERLIYARLDECIRLRVPVIDGGGCPENTLMRIIRLILDERPQYFWFEGKVRVSRKMGRILIRPCYIYGDDEISLAKDRLEDIRNGFHICESLPETLRAVYDWFLDNVSYSPETPGQNIYNALIERKAVCKGLSKAYQYILAGLGINCLLRRGTLDGRTGHMWNAVKLGGGYHNIDISLAYPRFDSMFVLPQRADRYRTFIKTDDEINRALIKENVLCRI